MALSRMVREELLAERKRIVDARKALEHRLSAIDEILRPELSAEQLEMRVSQEPVPIQFVHDMGLRDAIRTLLKEFPKGVLPRELAKILTDRGFTPGGKTRLSTLVSSELWRMVKRGDLEKISRGRYRLKEGAAK